MLFILCLYIFFVRLIFTKLKLVSASFCLSGWKRCSSPLPTGA